MKPLEIHVRNRVMFAKIEAQKKFIGSTDYTLFDKNKVSIYIFRDDMGSFTHVYGKLDDDVREACIDALILRFQQPTEMIYHKGERKVIEVDFVTGGSKWQVLVNKFYCGSFTFSETRMKFEYHEHNVNEVITPERIEKYKDWLREGKIKWPDRWT